MLIDGLSTCCLLPYDCFNACAIKFIMILQKLCKDFSTSNVFSKSSVIDDITVLAFSNLLLKLHINQNHTCFSQNKAIRPQFLTLWGKFLWRKTILYKLYHSLLCRKNLLWRQRNHYSSSWLISDFDSSKKSKRIGTKVLAFIKFT